MPGPDLSGLRSDLLRAGISPAHVHRAVREIGEHYEDIVADRVAQGDDRGSAEQAAVAALGDLAAVSAAMSTQTELKSWAWRYPRIALLVYPLACVAALPAVPLRVGVEKAPLIGRWAACLAASALLTATLFLVLQLSIQPSL